MTLKAVQWHYLYCEEAEEELKVNKEAYRSHDTSHDLSVIDSEGVRHRIGTFKHSEWASEVGQLIEKYGLSGIK